jgi:hypothetical protein
MNVIITWFVIGIIGGILYLLPELLKMRKVRENYTTATYTLDDSIGTGTTGTTGTGTTGTTGTTETYQQTHERLLADETRRIIEEEARRQLYLINDTQFLPNDMTNELEPQDNNESLLTGEAYRAERQRIIENEVRRQLRDYREENSHRNGENKPKSQCPPKPRCPPKPQCPPQRIKYVPNPNCPDLRDYIRKDSIPCWGCKLK